MPSPSLTVAYLTFRSNPRFEWFVASLNREFRNANVDPASVQILVVDGRFPRKLEADFPFEHCAPKPTVWQGAHRLTQRDYFCAANSRNTVFALARASHVVFVDDLSVLLPGWLEAHMRAEADGYVLCGTTCKHKNIEVNAQGDVVKWDDFPPGTDSRIAQLPDPLKLVRCSGGWLYGGTFSVPLEHALRVNGQDEIHDTIGGEDYDFGARLERSGSEIYITRACGTFEDEDGHHTEAPMVRLDKPWPPAAVRAPRTFYQGSWSAPAVLVEPMVYSDDGPYSSNYLYYRVCRETTRVGTIGNTFDLRELRDRVLAGAPFPVPAEPTVHWVDGQPLSEM